ncbi:hypothetical protein [Neptuniibacter sp. QD37_11]|uniref:hypothetical protein n=1 Tax=Neptuniibacter sp. QD37_11 TaxID=3398209 RepID=UPI0039F45C72
MKKIICSVLPLLLLLTVSSKANSKSIIWLHRNGALQGHEARIAKALGDELAITKSSLNSLQNQCVKGAKTPLTVISANIPLLKEARQLLALKDDACKYQLISVLNTTKGINRHYSFDSNTKHLVVEQPLVEQVRYVDDRLPDYMKIGVLHSYPPHSIELSKLKREVRAKRNPYIFEGVSNAKHAIKKLKDLADKVDVIIVGNHAPLLSKKYLKAALIYTVRKRIPMLGGPSSDLIRSGFLGGVYSTDKGLVDALNEIIFNFEDAAYHTYSNEYLIKSNKLLAKQLRMEYLMP